MAAVLAAAAAAGWATQGLHPPAPPQPAASSWWAAAAEGVKAAAGARATVRYTPQPWGTGLEAVSGIRPGTRCQIWVITASGQHAAGGGWTVTRGTPHVWYPASVPFPAGSLTGFDITTGGTVLVAIPLHPGTPPTPAAATAPASSP